MMPANQRSLLTLDDFTPQYRTQPIGPTAPVRPQIPVGGVQDPDIPQPIGPITPIPAPAPAPAPTPAPAPAPAPKLITPPADAAGSVTWAHSVDFGKGPDGAAKIWRWEQNDDPLLDELTKIAQSGKLSNDALVMLYNMGKINGTVYSNLRNML